MTKNLQMFLLKYFASRLTFLSEPAFLYEDLYETGTTQNLYCRDEQKRVRSTAFSLQS